MALIPPVERSLEDSMADGMPKGHALESPAPGRSVGVRNVLSLRFFPRAQVC
jgi:hypothetical protein